MHPATIHYQRELILRALKEAELFLTPEQLLGILARKLPEDASLEVWEAHATLTEYFIEA